MKTYYYIIEWKGLKNEYIGGGFGRCVPAEGREVVGSNDDSYYMELGAKLLNKKGLRINNFKILRIDTRTEEIEEVSSYTE